MEFKIKPLTPQKKFSFFMNCGGGHIFLLSFFLILIFGFNTFSLASDRLQTVSEYSDIPNSYSDIPEKESIKEKKEEITHYSDIGKEKSK
jgi:hypothetical protein